MHIFNMSVAYMQSVEKDTLNAPEGVDFTKYHYQSILFNMCSGRKLVKLKML